MIERKDQKVFEKTLTNRYVVQAQLQKMVTFQQRGSSYAGIVSKVDHLVWDFFASLATAKKKKIKISHVHDFQWKTSNEHKKKKNRHETDRDGNERNMVSECDAELNMEKKVKYHKKHILKKSTSIQK